MLSLLVSLKSKLWWIGSVVLAVLAAVVRMQSLKNARDKARVEADTLKATVHVQRVNNQIKKKERKKLSVEKAKIKEEIEKIERGEKSEGIDSLSNPNDF